MLKRYSFSKQPLQQMIAFLLFLYALIGGCWLNFDLKPFQERQIVRQGASHPIIVPGQQEKRMMLLSFTPYPEKKGDAVGFLRTHVMKKDDRDIIQGMGNLINSLIALITLCSSVHIDVIRAEYKSYEQNSHAGNKFDRDSGFLVTELPYFLGQINDQKTKDQLHEILIQEVKYLQNNTGRITIETFLEQIEQRQPFTLKGGQYLLGRVAHSLWLSQPGVRGVYAHLASYYPPLKRGPQQKNSSAWTTIVYHFRCGDLIKEGNKRGIPYPLVLIKAVLNELLQGKNLNELELIILSQLNMKGVHNKKDAASLNLCRFVVKHTKKLLEAYFKNNRLPVRVSLQNKSPREDFLTMVFSHYLIFFDSTYAQMAALLNLGRKALLLEKGEKEEGKLYGYLRGRQSKIYPLEQIVSITPDYIASDQFVEGREIYRQGLGKAGKVKRKRLKRLLFPMTYNRSMRDKGSSSFRKSSYN